jgi:hypothetical protein
MTKQHTHGQGCHTQSARSVGSSWNRVPKAGGRIRCALNLASSSSDGDTLAAANAAPSSTGAYYGMRCF